MGNAACISPRRKLITVLRRRGNTTSWDSHFTPVVARGVKDSSRDSEELKGEMRAALGSFPSPVPCCFKKG